MLETRASAQMKLSLNRTNRNRNSERRSRPGRPPHRGVRAISRPTAPAPLDTLSQELRATAGAWAPGTATIPPQSLPSLFPSSWGLKEGTSPTHLPREGTPFSLFNVHRLLSRSRPGFLISNFYDSLLSPRPPRAGLLLKTVLSLTGSFTATTYRRLKETKSTPGSQLLICKMLP